MRRRLYKINDDNENEILPQTSFDMGTNDGIEWSIYMLGTTQVYDVGKYYQWGDTTGYTLQEINKINKKFKWEDYKWCNGSSTTLTKYCTKSDYGIVDNKYILDLSDDAAHVLLGGKWRMPTQAEFERLKSVCSISYVTSYKGHNIKGKLWKSRITNNELFFPLAGFIAEEGILNKDETRIWTSKLDINFCYYGMGLSYNISADNINGGNRNVGRNIRPVLE
ncbi:MAG: hypothetical protein K2H20_00625, partial [Bacilli bacterium]|nr:hypothetical protein [Bacilli bacterium]